VAAIRISMTGLLLTFIASTFRRALLIYHTLSLLSRPEILSLNFS